MAAWERSRKQARAWIALGFLLACCGCAFALDPSLDISQYAHTGWKAGDGFSKLQPQLGPEADSGFQAYPQQ